MQLAKCKVRFLGLSIQSKTLKVTYMNFNANIQNQLMKAQIVLLQNQKNL